MCFGRAGVTGGGVASIWLCRGCLTRVRAGGLYSFPARPFSSGGCMRNHYDSSAHKRWREAVLRRAGYLCEECRRYGRLDKDGLPVRATTAHHIKHLDEYPELACVVSNGRALCEACHAKAHPEKGEQHGRRR